MNQYKKILGFVGLGLLLSAGTARADNAAKKPEAPAQAPAADSAQRSAAPSIEPPSGPFTLEMALAGLKGAPKAALMATIEVVQNGKPLGTFHCELYADKSPLTVANFVGLARGVRPFKDPKTSAWVKRPLYDNLSFHRVIPDFMIQGGDPYCQNDPTCGGRGGTGDPGYMFDDETQNGLSLDKGGLLAMANRGPGTNGSQFFISEKETPWLTGHHTVFGYCPEVDLVKKITHTERGPRDIPKDPITIKKVTISRKAK